ncbi:MAG TPA: hypothetical protein VJ766_07890 [Pseudoxanthomonas sp.]|nr:hypothetical protein [Pseudoxanthomonas sp.]
MTEPKPWFSGPPIDNLQAGWARIPFRGERTHYWEKLRSLSRAGERYYRSACEMPATLPPGQRALGPGNFPLCGNCLKKHHAPAAEERRTFIDAAQSVPPPTQG